MGRWRSRSRSRRCSWRCSAEGKEREKDRCVLLSAEFNEQELERGGRE